MMVERAEVFAENLPPSESWSVGDDCPVSVEPGATPPAAIPGEGILQALFEFDPETDRLSWSDNVSAARLLGLSKAPSVMERSDYDAIVLDVQNTTRVQAFAGEVQSYVSEYRVLWADGREHWVEERGGWIGTGPRRRLISVVRSIGHQKQREKRLSWLAENDELTGLLNRVVVRQRLDDWLSARRSDDQHGAYILVGIDDLGALNADFGFEVADQVIVELSRRMAELLGPNDSIGRVAGTKFGMIINDCDEAELRCICNRFLNAARESVVETSRGSVTSSVCLGVTTIPEHAADSQTAMACAEAALDQAKRLGRSSWSSFSEKTDIISQRRRNTHMSDVILTALNDRRIRLAFQAIVSDLDETPSKFECLIRMRGEDGREVSAPEFIPVAERLGLVHLLDRRVLELAINTLAICPNIHLNVNVSMETVKDAVWAEGYVAQLRANTMLAKRITVELTETKVIDAIDASIEFVSEIKELGCSFAIDDFGAGYTSFRNLKALDIDILKIDGSFVTGVASSRENQLFVRTLLDLARNFEMKTVAEWVENEADAMLLKGLGVDFLQGYLIGKPEVTPGWLPEGAPNDPPVRATRT